MRSRLISLLAAVLAFCSTSAASPSGSDSCVTPSGEPLSFAAADGAPSGEPLSATDQPTSPATVSSPGGAYRFSVSEDGGNICYTIDWNGRQVVSPSVLGLMFEENYPTARGKREGISLAEGMKLISCTESTHDIRWNPVYGERSTVRDHFNEMRVTFGKSTGRMKLIVTARAYDEGVAFRYRIEGGNYLKITREYTDFTLPEGTKAWFTARAQTPYALVSLKEWEDECERPLLLSLPDGAYACLAEAGVSDYCRSRFVLSDLRKSTIGLSMGSAVEDIAPDDTPWRVVMCGEKAGEILQNNDLLLNLNPPCAIDDPSWIRPGKVLREMTLSTEGGLAAVDFAVKHNLQYIHFDAGWYGPENDKASDATTVTLDPGRNPVPDALDLPRVIAYARSKGIGVFLYVNIRALYQQLDELLPLYKSWGVAGLKFGFVQVGSQLSTRWVHEAVAKCARAGLMVDIHDEYRPTGTSRTWPNLMTQEGIRGNEEFPDATHNTVLPFTRFVAGAGDYTICYYRQEFNRLSSEPYAPASKGKTLQTTPAHQLALSVVYYSPLTYMYWYDKPSDSADEPELKFFDDVYTTWDDTRVLDGAPGESAVVARRHGKEWFVGAITGNEGRTVSIDLSFLDKGKTYTAEIYTDGGRKVRTRTHVICETRKVTCGDVLRFPLRPSGGVALRLVP